MSIELLLHCEEQPPVDTSLNGYTVSSDGSLSSTRKWGSYSNYLSVTSSIQRKITVANADWGFGANNWTLDFWLRMTLGVENQIAVKGYSIYDPNATFALYYNGSNGNLYVKTSDSTNFGVSLASFSTLGVTSSSTFYHYSIARNGQYIYVVINGVLAGTITLPSASTLLHENTSYDLVFNTLPLATRVAYFDEICLRMGEYIDFVSNIPTGPYTDPEPVEPIEGNALGALQEIEGYSGVFTIIGDATGQTQESSGSATIIDLLKAYAYGSLGSLEGDAEILPKTIGILKQLSGSATAIRQKIGNAAGIVKQAQGEAEAVTSLVAYGIGKVKGLRGAATALIPRIALAIGTLKSIIGFAGDRTSPIAFCSGALKQLSGESLAETVDPYAIVRFVRGVVRK